MNQLKAGEKDEWQDWVVDESLGSRTLCFAKTRD